jgi:hypothetical protein
LRFVIRHPRGKRRPRIVVEEASSVDDEDGNDTASVCVDAPTAYHVVPLVRASGASPPLLPLPLVPAAATRKRPLEPVAPPPAGDAIDVGVVAKKPRRVIVLTDDPPAPSTALRSVFDVLGAQAWTPARIAALQDKLAPGDCNARHPHPRDADARTDFEGGRHDYYWRGALCRREDGWTSGSGFNHKLWKPFDSKYKAGQCAKTQDPKSEYFGKTAGEIETLWAANRDMGTAKHASYDAFMRNQRAEGVPPPVGFYRAVEELLTVHRLQPYRTEWTLIDDVHRINAQLDLVMIDPATGLLHLYDYKNCRDADLGAEPSDEDAEYGWHPFTSALKDCKRNHYRIQLSIYWYLLTEVYGLRVSRTIRLLNFRPAAPDEYQVVEFEPLDVRPLVALLPWRDDDPRHLQFPMPRGCLVPGAPFADDDPRALAGPTTRIRAPKGSGAALDNIVWTGSTYHRNGYALDETRWKHKWRWFQQPPKGAAGYYEAQLLQDQDALCLLPTLVGRKIACWCQKDEWRCHADVLVKYANLLAAGAFPLPKGPGMGMFAAQGSAI